MVHFFRAEVHRANIWRQRLDTTTNWAVVTTGAAISFAFSEPQRVFRGDFIEYALDHHVLMDRSPALPIL